MTYIDPKMQLLADYYYGADRTPVEYKSNDFDWGALGSEVGSTALWVGGPMLVAPMVKPYWSALGKWRKDPLCDSYSKALDKVRFEQQLENNRLRYLSYDKAGNKYNLFDRYMNKARYNTMNEMYAKLPNVDNAKVATMTEKEQIKLANKNIVNEQMKDVRKLLQEVKDGKIPAKDLKAHYAKIFKKLQQADIKINDLKMKGIIKPSSTLGKIGHSVKKGLGVYKAKGFMLKSAKGFKFLKCVGKFGKGAGVFAAIGAVLAESGEVMGAREIDKIERAQGRKSNRMQKQLVKSGVVAGASIGGSILGAAAAGALVGTAAGPIGTVVGFIGGAIGGLVAGWLAKKATGPSEVEKYQKQQNAEAKKAADELAQQASGDNGAKDELLGTLLQAKEAGQIDDKEIIALLEEEVAAREQELQTGDVAVQNTTNDTVYKLQNLGNISLVA